MVDNSRSYYRILGVSTNASLEEIRNAYRRRSLEVHPDTSKSGNSHQEFLELQEAYQVLKDAKKRAEYDSACVEVPNESRAHETRTAHQEEDFEPIRCSVCNCVSAQPRYVVFWETVSFLQTIRSPVQGIMCTKCAGSMAYRATKKSLLLGWWGIWGLIFTPITVIGNLTGGERPAENNGKILLHQSWYFVNRERPDVAYFLARDAEKFLRISNSKEKETLLSICRSIIDGCKASAEGKVLDSIWDKALPETSKQWKAVGICALAWIGAISVVYSYSEEQTRKAVDGAPDYSYQQRPLESSKQPEITVPEQTESPPPIPTTYLPLSTGYLPNKSIGSKGGYSTIRLKNNSRGNFHVKMYERLRGNWSLSREVYLKANEEFILDDIAPGEYEIRRMDVQTKFASKSETFTLEQTEDPEGVRYSALTITLDVPNGNSRITPITASEF